MAVAGVVGFGVAEELDPFGIADQASESSRADERLRQITGAGAEPGIVAVVRTPRERGVQSRAGRRRVREVERLLQRDPMVTGVRDFVDTGDRSLLSEDGRASLLLVFFRSVDDKDREDAAERIVERLEGEPGVTLGGEAVANAQINEQVTSDLQRAEILAFPILFVLSFVLFRGLVAAALPPLLGGFAIVITMALLRVANNFVDISVYAVNLATGLGLGLAIDYALFIVTRYREEAARQGTGPEALRRTLETAGRTVLVSALTVAAALAALLVFPQRFLYSQGIGGVLVAVVAAGAALVVLPALLLVLGPRIDALAPKALQRTARREAQPDAAGRWYRWARWVARRPGTITVVTVVGLIALGTPFASVQYSTGSAELLPQERSARQADELLTVRFAPNLASPIRVVVDREPSSSVRRLRRRIAALPGIERVSPVARVGDGTSLMLATARPRPLSQRAERIVRDVRALDAPFPVLVAGRTAAFVDAKASLADRVPIAAAIVVAVTVVLLFLLTGSLVLPIKSLLMNALTVAAVFGAMTLVFQEGRLEEELLGHVSQGAIDISQPILIFALVFGLSTDYAVFLLSRIKEARDAGADDSTAVALGIERTGRIVTAAAVLFAVALGAFTTGELSIINQLGFGTALGVLIDATIIRALLVPALMELLGSRNWWAPGPLRALHRRVGLSETMADPVAGRRPDRAL